MSIPKVSKVLEDGRWSMFMNGVPIAGDGITFEDAVEDMVSALRGYAEAWDNYLFDAVNHRMNVDLVQMVQSCTDEQLGTWLRSQGSTA